MSYATITHSYDATTNDSDKTITVPSGRAYRLLYGLVTLTSTATVGNRQLVVRVYNDSDQLVWNISAGAVQAASLTYEYSLSQGAYRETATQDSNLLMNIPPDLWLKSGWYIQILDEAAVDAASDDLTYSLVFMDASEELITSRQDI